MSNLKSNPRPEQPQPYSSVNEEAQAIIRSQLKSKCVGGSLKAGEGLIPVFMELFLLEVQLMLYCIFIIDNLKK